MATVVYEAALLIAPDGTTTRFQLVFDSVDKLSGTVTARVKKSATGTAWWLAEEMSGSTPTGNSWGGDFPNSDAIPTVEPPANMRTIQLPLRITCGYR